MKFLRGLLAGLLMVVSIIGWVWFPTIPFSSSLKRYLPGGADASNSFVVVNVSPDRDGASVESVQPLFDRIQSLPYVTSAQDPLKIAERFHMTLPEFVNNYSILKRQIPFLRTIPFVDTGGINLNGLYHLSTEGLKSTDILEDIETIQNQTLPDDWDFRAGGEPVINGWLTRASVRTQQILFPLLVGAGVVLVALLYRSFRVLVVFCGAVFVSVGFPFFIMILFGYPHDLLSILAPLLVLIITLASGVHFLSAYYQSEAASETRVKSALARKWKPVLLCHITTAVGFGSLAISTIPAVRALGITTFFGLGLMSIFYFAGIPPFMKWLSPPNRQWTMNRVPNLRSFYNRDLLRAVVLIGVMGLFLAGGWSFLNVDYETRALTYFPDQHPVRRQFSGISRVFVSPRGGQMKLNFKTNESGPTVKSRRRWRRNVTQIKGIDRVLIPPEDNSAGKGQLESVFFVTFDGLAHLGSIRSKLREQSKQYFSGLRKLQFMGVLDRIYRAQSALKNTLYQSLGLSGLVIFGLIFLFFGDLPVFLSVVVANLFPIAAVLTLMYATGYSLSAGTIVVFSMILGLAVNDTIHITGHVQEQVPDIPGGIRANIRPVLFTSLILAGGLSVFVTADFQPVKQFGLFTTCGIGFALIGDFFVLPVVHQLFIREEF
ncbi:MAG: RND family transporter [bacterium]